MSKIDPFTWQFNVWVLLWMGLVHLLNRIGGDEVTTSSDFVTFAIVGVVIWAIYDLAFWLAGKGWRE